MLKTAAGIGIGNVPGTPVRGGTVDVEALTVEDAARISGFSRSFIYQALNSDPAKRKGLPLLRSLKAGRARRIRPSTLRQWLSDLEKADEPPASERSDGL